MFVQITAMLPRQVVHPSNCHHSFGSFSKLRSAFNPKAYLCTQTTAESRKNPYVWMIWKCVRENKLDEVEAIYKTIKEGGFPTTFSMYRGLFHTFARKRNTEALKAVYAELLNQGLYPNREMFTLMMSCFGKEGLVQQMLWVLEEMSRQNVAPDVVVYSCLLDGFGRAGDIANMEKMFEKMQAQGIEPDAKLYIQMIRRYGQVGKVENALKLLKKMKELKMKADVGCCNSILNACVQNNDNQNLQLTLDIMRESEITPSQETYKILITHFAKSNLPNYVKQTIDEMEASGCEMNTRVFASLLETVGASGDIERMMSMYHGAVSTKVQLNREVFCVALSYAPTSELKDILVHMKERDFPIKAINGYLDEVIPKGKMDHAMNLFAIMKESPYVPNVATYSILINAHGKLGNAKAMEELFEDMKQAQVQPNVYIYTNLMQGYHDAFEPAKVVDTWKEMKQAGIEPTSVTLDLLVRCAKHTHSKELFLDIYETANAAELHIKSEVFAKLAKAVKESNMKDLFAKMPEIFNHALPQRGPVRYPTTDPSTWDKRR